MLVRMVLSGVEIDKKFETYKVGQEVAPHQLKVHRILHYSEVRNRARAIFPWEFRFGNGCPNHLKTLRVV
jgi:alpha-amylase/alpha-mannosidase (GH57 family)